MTPNPNPPTNPQNTADNANTMNGNAANATPFNGDSPDRSKVNSPEERPSPPRMYSPETDGMDVDVEDDEKQNTKQQQRGTKRAWSEDETTNDQKEPLSSSEPIAKKRRTHESITPVENSTTAPPTTCVPEKGCQKKVNLELVGEEITQLIDYLTNQKNPLAANTLLFGEDTTNWPKGKFQGKIVYNFLANIKNLFIKCGAVRLNLSGHEKFVLFSSDFDHALFRAGLLDLYLQGQSLLENKNDQINKNNVLSFTADWGDREAMRLLLQNGANPGSVDDDGTSVLMTAARKGHIEIMELLLNYAIDPNVRNELNESALTVAVHKGHISACRLLLQHPARLDE